MSTDRKLALSVYLTLFFLSKVILLSRNLFKNQKITVKIDSEDPFQNYESTDFQAKAPEYQGTGQEKAVVEFPLESAESANLTTENEQPRELVGQDITNPSVSLPDTKILILLKAILPFTFSETALREGKVTIDQILSEIRNVKTLDLSNLTIEEIPIEIASCLVNLEELSLRIFPNKNSLEGLLNNIPTSKLRRITLRNLKSTEDNFKILNSIESLKEVEILYSKLSKIVDESFKALVQRLTFLRIAGCYLVWSEFQTICANGKELEYLDLENSTFINFSKSLQIVFPAKLKSVNLSRCDISPSQLNTFLIPQSLTEINLSGNNFYRFDMAAFDPLFGIPENLQGDQSKTHRRFTFKQMKSISLEECKISSEEIARRFLNIDGLESLNLAKNEFSINFKEFEDCESKKSLLTLNLSYNAEISRSFIHNPGFSASPQSAFEITFTDMWEFLGKFSRLRYLDISGIRVESTTESLPSGNLAETLEHLKINKTNANMNTLKCFTDLKNLKILEAAENIFSNLNEKINFSASLEEIDLSKSKLDNIGLSSILKSPGLKKLSVNESNFTNLNSEDLKDVSMTIKALSASSSRLTTETLSLLTNHFNFEELLIDSNDFSQSISSDKKIFGNSSQSLKILMLDVCPLNDQMIKEINENFTSLMELGLNGARIGNKAVDESDFTQLNKRLPSLRFDTNRQYNFTGETFRLFVERR